MSPRSALLVALVAIVATAAPAAATDASTHFSVLPVDAPGVEKDRRDDRADDGNQTRRREPCANLVHDGTASGQEINLFLSGSYGFRLVHPASGAVLFQVTPYWCLKGVEPVPFAGPVMMGALAPERDDALLLP